MEEEYPLLVRPCRDTRPSVAFIDRAMVARKADVRMPPYGPIFTFCRSTACNIPRYVISSLWQSRREDHLRKKTRKLTQSGQTH